MAEAASVIRIISFGIQIAQGLLQYYGSWRDQDRDVADMCASLDSFSRTLAVLSETFQRHDLPRMTIQKRVVESVDRVNIAMKKLKDELNKLQNTESPKPGVRATMRRHVRRALYPFKEETLQKIRNAVSEARSDLDFTLQTLHIESISEIRPEIKLLVRWKEDEETKIILRWLSPVNFWLKQEDVCKQREPETGKWLLEHSDFLEWEKGNKEMLWCCGSPGVGKTVLASSVIEFLEKDLSLPSIGLAFIYCNHKEHLVQTVEYFLSAIIRQLVERRPAIPYEIRSLYEKHRGKETKPTCQEYVELLRFLAHEFSEVYVVIDALDECIDKNGRIIWNGLLSQLKSSVLNLHLLYTSRDIEDIAGILTGSTHIEIRASDADIQAYVRAQVKSAESLIPICEQDAELENKILQAIATKAEGIFLAVQLYIEFLALKTNPRAVKKALNALPSTLDENYEEAMKRIERSPTKLLGFKVLKWIVYAVRPLQLEEVQHAVAVDELDPEDESVTKDCLTPPSTIVNACAGLIRIDKESDVVGLVHKTAQEYFDKSGTNHFPHAHRDMTTSCLRYLSLPIFSTGPSPSDELFQHRLQENALLDYAVRSLGDHMSRGFDWSLKDLALKVFLDQQTIYSASQVPYFEMGWPWESYRYEQTFRERFHGVHFAAYYGLTDIVELLIETAKVDVDSKDSDNRTPLLWAAARGHEAVVKLLLAMDEVELNTKDNLIHTPLSLAAKNGHEAVVKLLLAKDEVELNTKDNFIHTPLSLAAQNGHEAVVKLLLAKDGVELNPKNYFNQTPLLIAADNGHEAVIKLLLANNGVELYTKDCGGETAISLAAKHGHEAVLKLLLAKNGVELNSRDKRGYTPLILAIRAGFEAVAKLLLVKDGVELNAKDKEGYTPLLLAAGYGQEAVVKLLLAKDAVELNARDKYDYTPLLLAAGHGHEAVVKLLLAKDGVELNSRDKKGYTPLILAIRAGREAVAKLILAKDGVELNSKDKEGYTPLLLTAGYGQDAVVKLLLAKDGVELNARDKYGQTSLLLAAKNGHEAVVKLLSSIT